MLIADLHEPHTRLLAPSPAGPTLPGPSGLPAAGTPAARPRSWAWPAGARVLHALRRRFSLLAFATVVVPTLAAIGYFGFVASDVYVSESTFVVRSAERQPPGGLMGALLPGAPFGSSQDDARVVHHYMRSRDAMAELERRLGVRQAYSSTATDRLSRFPLLDLDESDEAFFRYWRERVSADVDGASSLSLLRVSAFDADTAARINAELLALSEQLVNQLNVRIRDDAVRYATLDVERAEKRASEVALQVAAYRSENDVFDPDKQSALQLAQTGRLQEELIAARGQLAQVQTVSPQNPQLPALNARVRMLEGEIGRAGARVTGRVGSLTQKAGEMQRLAVQQASADRQLTVALGALEQARNEARRKQLYLERIAAPHRPDAPVQPRRLRAVLTTFVLGLFTWGLLGLVLAAVREHRD